MDRNTARAEIRREFLRACQTPSDINEHLPMLYYLASQCIGVVEFGVRYGASTRAFMAAAGSRRCGRTSRDTFVAAANGGPRVNRP